MAEDLLEKEAILQRDKETYAIAPHIPGGIITDFNLLRRLADVAEKYGVKAIKLTSAQRFALVGLKPEDLDPVWQELGMVPGAAIGLCVRSIKICPGTTFCRSASNRLVWASSLCGCVWIAWRLSRIAMSMTPRFFCSVCATAGSSEA